MLVVHIATLPDLYPTFDSARWASSQGIPWQPPGTKQGAGEEHLVRHAIANRLGVSGGTVRETLITKGLRSTIRNLLRRVWQTWPGACGYFLDGERG